MLKMIKEACCDMNALSTLTLVFHRISSKTVTYAHTKKKSIQAHTQIHTHLSGTHSPVPLWCCIPAQPSALMCLHVFYLFAHHHRNSKVCGKYDRNNEHGDFKLAWNCLAIRAEAAVTKFESKSNWSFARAEFEAAQGEGNGSIPRVALVGLARVLAGHDASHVVRHTLPITPRVCTNKVW